MNFLGGWVFSGGSPTSKSRRRWLAVAACAYAAIVLQSNAAEPAAEGAQPGPAPTHHESALAQRVTLLSAELGLSAQQQDQVRRILEDQREQVMRVWNDSSLAAPNRVS